jgi:aspartate-semialdehyde dehydrogenase
VVGSSSLRGKEILELLPGSALPVHDAVLLDDAALAGTITDAAGEAAFIRGVEADSFEGASLAFFAGMEEFTALHWAAAQRAGAAVIDLSGALDSVRAAAPLIPSLEFTLGPPRVTDEKLYRSPGAPAIVAATIAGAFRRFPLRRLAATFLQPVSERDQAGIQELEAQTVSLLSFQPFTQEVFDRQVAFNFLESYGESSRSRLEDDRARVAREVADYLDNRVTVPAIQLIQAPVFYGCAFSVYAEFDPGVSVGDIGVELLAAGVSFGEESPTNAGVAGSGGIQVALTEDANVPAAWWIWGVVDSVRLAAQNAVNIAERIVAAKE